MAGEADRVHSVSGLTWVDKDKKMFAVPWSMQLDTAGSWTMSMFVLKRGPSTQGNMLKATWEPKDVEERQLSRAMNSLPDIEESEDKGITKATKRLRVFRMLPASPKSGVNEAKQANEVERDRAHV
ncbi:hypothetical protein FQN60_000535 [Etheostoma spectabile]|uniref:IRF tryptophan pentad repeat domain-containing protein n=1 Tax=Etheostoma spectabile TaxID=54343 RepID=A0A5J5CZT9_9PERO|nr:hypothetical protein FQN60_000535 [Etheostoma spectabile]